MATAVVVVAILYLTLVPRPVPDDMLPHFEGFDKVAHFCMFGGLAGVAMLDRLRKGKRFLRFRATQMLVVCVLTLLFGIAVEIAQQTMELGRGGDLYDALADGLGIVAAYFVVKILLKNETDS